ncbi:acetyltransferase [Neisseria gonorrhoeae]|uniref:Acetyltransferase n=6 Tax=Pseudomonadota TaxID=1224 RepID=A0A378W2Q3_NEIGO|nr:acetyltransferase [Neisseria gonorrhoeae]
MQADFNRPVLAVDTGTSYLSLALRADGEIRLFHQEVGIRQSELILPEIRTLFRNAGITAADLGAIVYAKGPGAFTGLRIGIGVAQGLATPFDTPLIGIPTLDAAASLPPPQSCILAAADARMGEVFYAWFDTLNRRRLSDYQVGRAADIALPEGYVFQTASAVRSHWKPSALLRQTRYADRRRFSRARPRRRLSRNWRGTRRTALRPQQNRPDCQRTGGTEGTNMNIRPALPSDCAALAALDTVCNPSAWTQRQFESALVSPSEQVFLAEKDGRIAAFIVWQNLPDESELHLIATAPECRRRGVASALLEYWYAHLPEGTQRLLLEVRAGNAAAQALYTKHGFSIAGRRKNYYCAADGQTEDAVLMEKYVKRALPPPARGFGLGSDVAETGRRRPAAQNTPATPAQARPQTVRAATIRPSQPHNVQARLETMKALETAAVHTRKPAPETETPPPGLSDGIAPVPAASGITKLAVVSLCPPIEDAVYGQLFHGKAGILLDNILKAAGLDAAYVHKPVG